MTFLETQSTPRFSSTSRLISKIDTNTLWMEMITTPMMLLRVIWFELCLTWLSLAKMKLKTSNLIRRG
jgi:hypothetical protein